MERSEERIVQAPPVVADPEDKAQDEGDESGGAPSKDTFTLEHHDGCGDEEMRFEGKCYPKKSVKDVLEMREAEAIRKVQEADEPVKAAKAANQLLEQQINQAAKAEDDLDEILEMLKEKDRKRDSSKKGKRR